MARKRDPLTSPTRGLLRIAAAIGALALLFLIVTQFFFRPWIVVGDSMNPALTAGDRVWIELAPGLRRSLGPGDVVLIRGPSTDRRTLAKRIVRIATHEEHRAELWDDLGGDSTTWYWVEGDNRSQSLDSRTFGAVPEAQILGRLVY